MHIARLNARLQLESGGDEVGTGVEWVESIDEVDCMKAEDVGGSQRNGLY